jgi:hypothetical protein
LYQLLHCLPYVPQEVRQLYSRNASGQPSTEEMTTCLIALIRREKEVRILGDAFDECTQWNVLWKFLTRMANSQCPSLRLLFTSRPEREIENAVNALGIPNLDHRTVMDGDRAIYCRDIGEQSKSNLSFTRKSEGSDQGESRSSGRRDVRHTPVPNLSFSLYLA